MAAWAAGLLRVRWLARAPIGLYRARLGFLLGSRLLMLEHLGRKSGARRYAVLEVVARPRPGTYVVASGFGTRAQWFRNVRANPHVRIYAGGHRPAPAPAGCSPVMRQPRRWRPMRPGTRARGPR
jgi:deazaflavin-dependent oxidoreductase (nitroreductase family)